MYEAQELASGRRVALKVLLADLALSEEAFERFRREARIAASLSDSRCVFVYGAHEVEGAPAIAMELVGGETLEQRIAKGAPIPVEQAVRWTIQILEGLEAAAESGIVHRDVKPSNCFLTEDGHVKVGDFGLARTVQADLRLTLSGQFLGSPLYASPEQVKGREVDHRSDLYSCGATLYALLTGRPPHSGSNLGEVLASILSESPPSPRELRPEVPRGLARLVLRSLDRDPRRRFQTHAEMRGALLAYVGGSSAPAPLVPRTVAFVLDLALASIIAGGALELAALAEPSLDDVHPDQPWRLASAWVDWLMVFATFVCFAAFEAGTSTTPGKWALGLGIATSSRTTRERWSLCVRSLVFFSPVLARDLYLRIVEPAASEGTLALVSLANLLPLLAFVSARRSNGWRGLHELASCTRTIRIRQPFASAARATPPPETPIASYPGMPERVGDYAILGAIERTPWGILLKARDEALERKVWMLQLEPGRAPLPEARRQLHRMGRVRWLAALESGGRWYEVFEDPGGASLLACAARGLEIPFPTQRRLLASLASELAWSGAERLPLHRLWVDRSWSIRVLDAGVGEAEGSKFAPPELLTQSARALLPKSAVLPIDLPESAEPIARRLYGVDAPFEELGTADNALAALESRPARVTRRARAIQLGWAVAPLGVIGSFGLGGMLLFLLSLGKPLEAEVMTRSLVRGTVPVVDGATLAGASDELRPLTDDERRARQILVSDWKRNGQRPWIQVRFNDEERAQIEHAVELHPEPAAEELEWAGRSRGPLEAPEDTLGLAAVRLIAMGPLSLVIFWWLLAVGCVVGFGRNPSFGLAELRVRDRRGLRASRWMLALRTTLAAAAVGALYVAAPLANAFRPGALVWIALAAGAAGHAALLAQSLVDPARGLHDRLLRTRIVPR